LITQKQISQKRKEIFLLLGAFRVLAFLFLLMLVEEFLGAQSGFPGGELEGLNELESIPYRSPFEALFKAVLEPFKGRIAGQIHADRTRVKRRQRRSLYSARHLNSKSTNSDLARS
jgi:hypothetical protein